MAKKIDSPLRPIAQELCSYYDLVFRGAVRRPEKIRFLFVILCIFLHFQGISETESEAKTTLQPSKKHWHARPEWHDTGK